MKKLLLLSLLTIINFFYSSNVICQTLSTEDLLKQKYWNYRERLKKYFTHIGSNQGESLILHQHNKGKQGGVLPVCDPNTSQQTLKGLIKFGDVPEALGMQMAAIALEYRLLKDEGKNVSGVLNELYYLISAVNRLDLHAEGYFSGTNSLNGFLMRDDVQPTFNDNFTLNAYPVTQDPEDNLDCTHSDYGNPAIKRNDGNEMSQDHVLDLFLGFSFVNKLVDPTEVVQPTAQDPPVNLVSEVKAITDRIMTYLTSNFNLISDQNLGSPTIGPWSLCQWTQLQVHSNYSIKNPVTNDMVDAGAVLGIIAYPVSQAAEKITGTTWTSHPLHVSTDAVYCGIANSTNDYLPLNTPGSGLPGYWESIGNLSTILSTSTNDIKFCYTSSTPANAVCIGKEQFTSDFTAVYLMMNAATLSKTWSHADVAAIGAHFNMIPFDLQYSVLHNEPPVQSQAYYENILMTAPCEGPYDHNYSPTTNPVGTHDPDWHKSNRWTHPNGYEPVDSWNEFQGDYPGYDYMFLHNLYRYVFRNQINGSFSENNSCPCTSNAKIDINSVPAGVPVTLNNSITVQRKFPEYIPLGFGIKEYLTHDLDIPAQKTLGVETDLVVCNNSTLTIQSNASLHIGNTSNIVSSLTIRSGSQLIFKNGSDINAFGNSKIIVESGASLVIEPDVNVIIKDNAQIVSQDGSTFNLQITANKTTSINLEGPNSLLDIQTNCYLNLEPGSALQFGPSANNLPGGGLVRFAKGTFNHNNNTTLLVDRCTLLFDYAYSNTMSGFPDQMVYNYYGQANLKLLHNSILDLRGDLKLFPTSALSAGTDVFTFTGQNNAHGFIKFGRTGYWGNSAKPHIFVNSKSPYQMIFKGNSKTDKVLEVATETVYIPDHLDSFVVNKGLVEFTSDGARLQTGSPFRIQTATFAGRLSSNTPYFYRGLTIFGQPHKILYDVTFKDLGIGCYNYAFFNAGPQFFNVKKCSFQNCGTTGLGILGAGLNVANSTFTDCDQIDNGAGLDAAEIYFSSTVSGCTFQQSGTKDTPGEVGGSTSHIGTGIRVTSLPVDFRVSNTSIKGFASGLDAAQTNVFYKCGNFKNNLEGVWLHDYAGINMAHPNYNPQNPDPNASGWVDASDNGNTIRLQNAFNIDVLGGDNKLKPTTPSGNCFQTNLNHNYLCEWAIYGTLAPPSPPCINPLMTPPCPPPFNWHPSALTIVSDNNFWKNPVTQAPYTSENIYYPTSKVNSITYDGVTDNNGNPIPVTLEDNNPWNNLNQVPACENALPCPNPPNCIKQLTIVDHCPTCHKIITPHFNNVATNDALKTALSQMNLSVPDGFKTATVMLSEIMLAQVSSPSEEDLQIKRLARQSMNKSISEAYLQKQIQDSLPAEATLQSTKQALDAIISVPDPGNMMYSEKLFAMMEKAQIHRTARLRTEAITMFNDALVFAKPQDQSYVQRWLCITQTEQNLLTKQLNRDSIDYFIGLCNPQAMNRKAIHASVNANGSNEGEIPDEDLMLFKVFPNPAANELFIAYQLEKSTGSAEFQLYDMQGHLVKLLNLAKDQRQAVVNNLELPGGVYYYTILADNKIAKTEKLIIMK